MNAIARIVLLAFVCLSALGAFGCTPPLPDAVVIDARFTPEQRTVIVDALDQWCEATAGRWCPDVATNHGAPIWAEQNYARHHRPAASAAFNDGSAVYVNVSREDLQDAGAYFHATLLHELGHFGLDGHLDAPGLLMSWTNCTAWAEDGVHCTAGVMPDCIDQASADAFCDQQGWSGCVSTCEVE